ncbi:MAG TPA: ImmA/IrrE family metallo-endopeptidase [Pyrinomonadaceae bacterium]|nr:ImmA/IrrE family metallo-endopeptidase [Pyrinomonadaceae bacterium]
MRERRKIIQRALTTALQVRQRAKVPLTDSLCIFDFAEANGIDQVHFFNIPSLEEVYWKQGRKIIVSSLRPPGRQAFNCAHGFGHHVFGHGNCIAGIPSEDNGIRLDPNEFLVDCFAGFLVMPRSTVSHGFVARGWNSQTCTPVQAFTVAGWLGVGYTTLIHHMRDVLSLISHAHADSLLKVKPKQIRAQLIGREANENVISVDAHWTGRPVDLEVGDVVLLPPSTVFEGKCLDLVKQNAEGTILRGAAPGEDGRVAGSDWSTFLRVSKRAYHGLNLFRHREDPDYVRN